MENEPQDVLSQESWWAYNSWMRRKKTQESSSRPAIHNRRIDREALPPPRRRFGKFL